MRIEINLPEQVAVAFAEWICNNGFDSTEIAIEPKWTKGLRTVKYTTKELYEIFKRETGKSN